MHFFVKKFYFREILVKLGKFLYAILNKKHIFAP